MNYKQILSSILLAALLVNFHAPNKALADSSIMVNSSADNTTSDGFCTLREALDNSNNNAQTHTDCTIGSGVDTIIFANGIGTITLSNTYLSVADTSLNLTIIDGGGDVTISGDNNTQRIFLTESSIELNNITLDHGGCTSCSGGGVYVGSIDNVNITVTNSTFNANSGGAINTSSDSSTVTITDSTFTNNSNLYGGAISAGADTTVHVTGSTFSGNTTNGGGGSAIYSGSELSVSNSSFLNNADTNPSQGGRGSIYIGGGTGTITNSTFYHNTTGGPNNNVGAIYNEGALTITNSTFSDNGSTSSGGAGDIYQLGAGSVLNLYNNIFAATSAGVTCDAAVGTVNGNNNLFETAVVDADACGFTDNVAGNIVNHSPGIGTLTGSPAYFPLNFGSPAIDSGTNSGCPATDQRGVTRPFGAQCDMGSYEYNQFLTNGSFEAFSGKIPNSWTNNNFGTKDGKTTTHEEGTYAVKIIGNGTTKNLSQTITGFNGSASDQLTFSVWMKGSKLPKTKTCKAQVILFDGATKVIAKIVKCPKGTYNWQQKTLHLTAPADYTEIKVIFSFSKASGTVYFDEASLLK